ncbi:hypothetical protein LJC59_10345 [Desulfovibrio sp. OttesenSCG-928-A18]|nr:hypothetical protein [Desulfovibrio sp. OttesenSCG-928-A18]
MMAPDAGQDAGSTLPCIPNGCSGGVDWFYRNILRREPPFGFCCDEHDVAYYEGGNRRDRWLADWRLALCLWEDGRRVKAVLFWLAVRVGGWAYWFRAYGTGT